jgi:hypothetical protein
MTYIFRGRLCGYICSECREPLRRVKVRLYKLETRDDAISRAVANPKETFAILKEDEVKAKQSRLIAEAETDTEGNFNFELGEKQEYDGSAFEVDVYVDSIEGSDQNEKLNPVQFSITVLQPLWRQRDDFLIWGWEYCLPYRWWCLILRYLGIWVICGRVLLCEERNRPPVPGVKVIAFDRDWLQDDMLGSAVTDSNGGFHIYYTTATFEPGTWLNVELTSGPDVYFRVETTLGAPLLVEPPSRGRDPDRENVGHCFCVTLCLKDDGGGGDVEALPFFSHLGAYKYSTQIQSAPAGSGLTTFGNRAFYSSVRLNGVLSKKLNGNPMEYRFETRELNAAGVPIGAWTKVNAGQIGKTYIGRLERANPNFPATDPNPIEIIEYVTASPAPDELLATTFSDAQGDWIQVPQESSSPLGAVGFFTPNGNMIQLNTASLSAFPLVDLTIPTVLQAGDSVTSTGKPLVANKHFAIRMLVREQGTAGAGTQAGICQHVAIENTQYKTENHPSWMSVVYTRYGVAMVDVAQLIAAGCSDITTGLDVLFTAAHPNLGAVGVTMSGPGGPYSFTLPAASPGNHFGTATPSGFTVAGLASCAYIITVSAQVLLTTGDSSPDDLYDQIAFCKS